MLTYKTVKYQYAAFYWNDKELNENKSYSAMVTWPDGKQEVLNLVIEVRYEGYGDLPCQYLFLEITHNGFKGLLELSEDSELITDLIEH